MLLSRCSVRDILVLTPNGSNIRNPKQAYRWSHKIVNWTPKTWHGQQNNGCISEQGDIFRRSWCDRIWKLLKRLWNWIVWDKCNECRFGSLIKSPKVMILTFPRWQNSRISPDFSRKFPDIYFPVLLKWLPSSFELRYKASNRTKMDLFHNTPE